VIIRRHESDAEAVVLELVPDEVGVDDDGEATAVLPLLLPDVEVVVSNG
jgi:hypothetical protein